MNGQQGLVSAESGRLTEQPIDLSWPSTFYKQCVFLALAPIMFPLYFTLPDVKKQVRLLYSQKAISLEFRIGKDLRRSHFWVQVNKKLFNSLIWIKVGWIAFFTYLMVWWASVIGLTLGIPTEVFCWIWFFCPHQMQIVGLTVLAAGTSIPDLITRFCKQIHSGFPSRAVWLSRERVSATWPCLAQLAPICLTFAWDCPSPGFSTLPLPVFAALMLRFRLNQTVSFHSQIPLSFGIILRTALFNWHSFFHANCFGRFRGQFRMIHNVFLFILIFHFRH